MHKTAEIRIPPFVKKGDCIGIVAPAGALRDRDAFAAGVEILHQAGFRTRYRNDIFRQDGYLAGPDHERLAELHELWRDPEIPMLLAARGGYGSLRLLPGLDFDLIRSRPKLLVGFSDLSVLLCTIFQATGLIGLHGPMLSTLAASDKDSREAFFRLITGEPLSEIRPRGLEILKTGQAQGRLLPGNLSSLVHLIGTPYEPDWHGSIPVLEDIAEAPYRIDRLLSQLAASGRLERISGLILGQFEQCGETEAIWQRVLELTNHRPIPVWANFPCGHGATNQILPVGLEAEMDSSSGRLLFPSPLVFSQGVR